MSVRLLTASLVIAGFAACNVPPTPSPETQIDVAQLAVPPSVVRLVAPTPAQLESALSGDPKAMAIAITNEACMAPSTCPAEFGSCANWSGSTECDFQCGGFCKCIFDPDGNCEPELRGRTTFNSYRVCFDINGNACAECRQTTSFFCGC